MADANRPGRVPSLANLNPSPGVESVARVDPDADINPRIADGDRPGKVKKSLGETLADLGDVDGFGRDGEEDQQYAFQLADGVYKRKEGISSSDGSTSTQAISTWGSNRIVNLADPAEPQEATTMGYVDFQILDSQIRVHQAYGKIGVWDPATMWLDIDIPSGPKRRKVYMDHIHHREKTIYNGRIVLLNLWIGTKPCLDTGLKKAAEFSIFRGVENYYYFLQHTKESSHPAKGLAFIQEDDEEDELYGWLFLYHDFYPKADV